MALPTDRLKGLRVLVVDDNLAFLEVLESMLLSVADARVSKVRSVADAVKILETGELPDCVICDHGLGGKTGIELLKDIRSGAHQNVPRDTCFIVLTAYGDDHLRQAAVALDANNYVVKPIRTNDLLIALETAADQKPALKAASAYADIVLPAQKHR